MSIVRITVDDKQLALLIAFCRTNKMGCEIETSSARIKNEIPSDFRTPCPALKAFCGSEMMTTRGKMKPIEALDFILAYAKRNNLIEKKSITMDEQLQDVFGTQDSSILQSELPKRLVMLFD
jgi:chromatin remodeling complex protein RSC6